MSRDIAASIRQRLLNESKSKKRPFQELLQYFAMERFLYRLGQHGMSDRFILKGALLMTAWKTAESRPTVDIDLSAKTSNDHDHIRKWIEELCAMPVEDDGLSFDAASIEVRRIKEDADYEGIRIRFEATLARAKVPMQIDIAFGDVITPHPSKLDYPVILDLPAPRLLAYPRETVIAEKLEAITVLGLLNSRLKDYFDIWLLSKIYSFDGIDLAQALTATFQNRATVIEARPVGLTAKFSSDSNHQKQWTAFRKRGRFPNAPDDLTTLVNAVGKFAIPLLEALSGPGKFHQAWMAGGPWRESVRKTTSP